jgi:hypothetical protein
MAGFVKPLALRLAGHRVSPYQVPHSVLAACAYLSWKLYHLYAVINIVVIYNCHSITHQRSMNNVYPENCSGIQHMPRWRVNLCGR